MYAGRNFELKNMKNNVSTLDSFLINENQTVFSISHGRTMRKGPILNGILALAGGGVLLYLATTLAIDGMNFGVLMIYLFGLIVFLAGAFVCFAMSGVDVDVRNKSVREYLLFFKKFGTWIPIDKYPFLTVIKLQTNITYGTYVGTLPMERSVVGRTEENEDFEICLLNQSHHKRITIAITQNYRSAMEKAEKLAPQLGVSLTEFNPVKVSDKKRRKR
jgi:hypothetical protein